MEQKEQGKEQGKEQAKGPKPTKGPGGQNRDKKPQTRADREADRHKKLERKIERAGQPDTAVVSRKALETNAMVALLGQNDYYIDQLRKKVGFDSKIDVVKAMILLQANGAIRSVLAIVNAAMQHELGMTYEPAKGLEVPTVKPAKLDLNKILESLQEIISAAEATAAEAAVPTPATAALKNAA